MFIDCLHLDEATLFSASKLLELINKAKNYFIMVNNLFY